MSDSVSGTQNIGIVITDQVAASIQTKLDGIGKSATDTYASITRLQAAISVLGSTNGLDKVLADLGAVSAGMAKATQAQTVYNMSAINGATAAQRLATAQQQTAAATTRAEMATIQLEAATARTAAAQTAEAKALAALATEQQRTAIQTANAAAANDRATLAALRLQQAQDKAAMSAHNGASSIAEYAKSVLLFVGIGYGVEEVVKLGDEFVQLQNRIMSVSSSSADATQVFAALFQISQETRSNIETTVTSFQRLDTTMAQLGQTQAQTISIVKTLNEVIALASPTATNAKNGILELDKAFSAGTLHGQQLRAILTDLPQLVNTLASHMAVVNGVVTASSTGIGISRGEFEKLATAGKITAQVMAGALQDAAAQVDAKFQMLTPTLLGAHGAVNVLQNDFVMIIGHINTALNITTGLAAGILLLSNNLPQLAIGLTLVGVAAAAAFGPGLLASIAFATGAVISFSLALVSTPIGAIAVALGLALVALSQFSGGWQNALLIVAATVDDITELLDGLFFYGIPAILQTVPLAFETAFDQAYNKVAGIIDKITNATVDAFAKIDGNFDYVSNLATPKIAVDTTAWSKIGTTIATAVNKGFSDGGAGAQQYVQSLLNSGNVGTDQLNAPRKATITPPAAPKDSALASAEKSILSAVDPLKQYNLALQAANDLLKSGQITQSQYNQEVLKASETYKDASDPLRKYNDDLNQQLAILALLPKQQAAAQQIDQISNALRAKGITLTDSETASLLKKIAAVKAATEASQAQSQILSRAGLSGGGVGAQANAINSLQSNKQSGFTSGDAATATTDVISSIGLDPKNLQVQSASYVDIYTKMYADINTLRQKDLISERDAQTLKLQVAVKQNADNLSAASTFFTDLQSLSHSNNTALATIGKAAAIANATINTYQSATAAYASLASVPVVGPELGAVAAAAAIVAGLENVAQIKAQPTGFATGGYTGNSAVDQVAGVVHGQEYVLDAASVNRIGVGALDSLRAGAASVAQSGQQAGTAQRTAAPAESGQGQATTSGGTQLNHTNVNVLDPKIVGDFMATPAGETATLNLIRRNKSTIKQMVG